MPPFRLPLSPPPSRRVDGGDGDFAHRHHFIRSLVEGIVTTPKCLHTRLPEIFATTSHVPTMSLPSGNSSDARRLLRTRRDFLARNAMGVGSVALAWLLKQDRLLATPANVPRQALSFDMKPPDAAASAAGPRHDLPVHARRPQPHRPLRSQT